MFVSQNRNAGFVRHELYLVTYSLHCSYFSLHCSYVRILTISWLTKERKLQWRL